MKSHICVEKTGVTKERHHSKNREQNLISVISLLAALEHPKGT